MSVKEQQPAKGGELPKKKTVTRGDVMQALRQKSNQLIFQGKRPTYHQGMLSIWL